MGALPTVLKYIGFSLTTGLGVLGLLVNFRDEHTRRVTKSGRWLIVGIITSGLVVVALQAIEDVQKKKEREELFEQQAQGQHLLRNVRLSCWAGIALDDPVLVPVRDRLIATATRARAALISGADHVPGICGWGRLDERPISQISICSDSPFYPDAVREPRASSMLRAMEVVLRFYRDPIRVDQYPVHGYGRPGTDIDKLVEPDLEMQFLTGYDSNLRLSVGYDFDTAAFEMYDRK